MKNVIKKNLKLAKPFCQDKERLNLLLGRFKLIFWINVCFSPDLVPYIRWGAVLSDGKGIGSKDVTDRIIDCMQTAMGMLSTITKVINSLLMQLFGSYIIT